MAAFEIRRWCGCKVRWEEGAKAPTFHPCADRQHGGKEDVERGPGARRNAFPGTRAGAPSATTKGAGPHED